MTAPPRRGGGAVALVRTLSLRSRVALSFGLVILVLCGVLATVTWVLATNYVTAQRQRAVLVEVSADSALVHGTLRFRPGGLADLLAGLGGDPDASVLVRLDGRWSASGRPVAADAVPADMISAAGAGGTAVRRLDVAGLPVMAAAVPIGPGPDVLVELAPVGELVATRRFLALLLVAGTSAATVLGAAIGSWTARRSLRPLDELTRAAAQVARGDLAARLPEREDAELAALATTFNATVAELGERVRRDARFAGDVSHELRSPLTTLLGAADLLRRRRDELAPPSREAVDLLGSDLDRFARTVNDLLEISKMDEPVDERDLERLDLAQLVAAVLRRLGVDLELDVAAGTPPVLADRRRLDAVVANLCRNADRHGEGLVRVGVGPDDAGSSVRLEIDDAGPGVPSDQRLEIFERFARGRAAGRRGADSGSGLGLALVAGHVRRHGGAVDVAERPGGGARFVVVLPAAAEDDEIIR